MKLKDAIRKACEKYGYDLADESTCKKISCANRAVHAARRKAPA